MKSKSFFFQNLSLAELRHQSMVLSNKLEGSSSQNQVLGDTQRDMPQVEVWKELVQEINKKGESMIQVDTTQSRNRGFLRFSHKNSYADGSIYLRRIGIRLSRLVAAETLKFEDAEVQMFYPRARTHASKRRMIVMQNYLKELLGDKIPVVKRYMNVKPTRSFDQIEPGVDKIPLREGQKE